VIFKSFNRVVELLLLYGFVDDLREVDMTASEIDIPAQRIENVVLAGARVIPKDLEVVKTLAAPAAQVFPSHVSFAGRNSSQSPP